MVAQHGAARHSQRDDTTNHQYMSSLFDWSPRPRPQSPRSPRLSSPPPSPTALLQEQRVKREEGEEEQRGKEQRDNVDNCHINGGVVCDGVVGPISNGEAVGASNNNDSRDQEHESHESLHQELEVQQTKEKRENPCFIKDGGPKGTFRELRVWQIAVQLAARFYNDREMRTLCNAKGGDNAFARHVVTTAQLVPAMIARSNIHYGTASSSYVDLAYRLGRYDRAITEVENAIFHAVDVDSSLAMMFEVRCEGIGSSGDNNVISVSDHLQDWSSSESQRLVVALRNMLRPMVSARLALQKQMQVQGGQGGQGGGIRVSSVTSPTSIPMATLPTHARLPTSIAVAPVQHKQQQHEEQEKQQREEKQHHQQNGQQTQSAYFTSRPTSTTTSASSATNATRCNVADVAKDGVEFHLMSPPSPPMIQKNKNVNGSRGSVGGSVGGSNGGSEKKRKINDDFEDIVE